MNPDEILNLDNTECSTLPPSIHRNENDKTYTYACCEDTRELLNGLLKRGIRFYDYEIFRSVFIGRFGVHPHKFVFQDYRTMKSEPDTMKFVNEVYSLADKLREKELKPIFLDAVRKDIFKNGGGHIVERTDFFEAFDERLNNVIKGKSEIKSRGFSALFRSNEDYENFMEFLLRKEYRNEETLGWNYENDIFRKSSSNTFRSLMFALHEYQRNGKGFLRSTEKLEYAKIISKHFRIDDSKRGFNLQSIRKDNGQAIGEEKEYWLKQLPNIFK